MICPKCNTVNQAGSHFCKKCRYPLVGTEEVRKCDKGHIMDPSWEFCHWCFPERVPQGTVKEDQPVFKPTVREEDDAKPGGFKPTRPEEKVEVLKERPSGEKPGKARYTKVVSEDKTGKETKRKLVGWLVTFSRDPAGESFELRAGKHVIGAASGCNICIPGDPGMSGQHAELLYRNGKFILDDRMSTNGTYVSAENGEEVEVLNKVILNDRAEIRMGATKFRLIMLERKPASEEL